ncbi:MAG: protein kinase domain-containing protein [Terriglobia bacterium]
MTPDRWERVKEIFDAMVEQPPEKRAEHLAAACDGDESLRVEVERLLGEHERAGSFLESSANANAAFRHLAGAQQTLEANQIIAGRFRIVSFLAHGGMGVVYKAEDTRLPRLVALKFLPDAVARHPQALARFRREAQAASALNHPNICTIHDFVESEGQAFIVMEYLEGSTLEELIGSDPSAAESSGVGGKQTTALPADTTLQVALEIADALGAAHAHGLIHRDIKPSNIFVTARGQAKILDFGLAKLAPNAEITPRDGATSPISLENPATPSAAMGTLSYMSPEQARGEQLDPRSDLFSFGSVLYEMASGRRAFPGGSSAQVLDAILKRTPIPASQLNPELPSQFEEIIDKALEKDRELRYQSAADLVRDLNGVRAGTTRQGGPLRSARPASRRIRGAAIGAVVGSLLIAGLLAVKLVLTGPGKYPASKTIRVGGTVSSLAGTGLVLQENGNDDLPISSDGPFKFRAALPRGAAYRVTVLTQPSDPTQTCSVTTGNGTVTDSNADSVAVTCVTSSASIFTGLTATMTKARAGHTATLLPTGMVLIAGGINSLTPPPVFNSAELYNPATQTFTALASTMKSARYDHTATLLLTGQVLLTGGVNGSESVLSTAELYDPMANTFAALKSTMTTARRGHTATLLPNGQVLLAGGVPNILYSAGLNTAEIYDPTAQTFTALTSTMVRALVYHTATLLPNGRVFLAGGEEGNGFGADLNTSELYDPATRTFTALTATLATARFSHTATLLPNGQVLLAGGSRNGTGGTNGQGTVLNTAELYDPTANTFTAPAALIPSAPEVAAGPSQAAATALTATMAAHREMAAAALLPDGLVLITGGFTSSGAALNTAEVYKMLPTPIATPR